jgi:hypothetical protein
MTISKNPKLSELAAWAEQNGFRIEFELRDKESAQQAAALDDAEAPDPDAVFDLKPYLLKRLLSSAPIASNPQAVGQMQAEWMQP